MKKSLIIVLGIAQVVFATNIHCGKCAEKVRENISFEKGVTALEADAKTKLVTISFNTEKTDTTTLAKAINKLGYNAKVVDYKLLNKSKKDK